MTNSNDLQTQLDQAFAASDVGSNPEIRLRDGQNREIVLRVNAIERIGCLVDEITVHSPKSCEQQLKERSDQLSTKLQYLIEPILLLEFDEDAATAQLRSSPPSRVSNETRYFELVVGHESLCLRRYSRPKGEPRTTIPMELTQETLRRLVSDLSESFAD